MRFEQGEKSNSAKVSRKVYGTFHLLGDEFAIELTDLQEVVNAPETLQRMPLAPNYLRGLFSLRGQVLPVIDLHILLQTESDEKGVRSNRRMVVLRRGAATLGILFDSIGEVLRVAPEELVLVERRSQLVESGHSPVKAVLCRDNGARMIQVLDFGVLLQVRNLPAIEGAKGREESSHSLSNRMRDLYREKLIGFSVGDCAMALEMKCVAGIVESRDQKPSPLSSELCDSIIIFHNKMVPVIELRRLLRLPGDSVSQRILVCRIGADLVGFAVDEVTSIIPYSKERVQPIPVLHELRASVFHGCFTDREGKDFIVLNEEQLLSREEILEVSVGHGRINQEESAARVKEKISQMSLLTFRMGKLYGLKLLDVLEVLESPEEFAKAPDMPSAVLGIMSLRGAPISVLDPRVLFNLGPAPEERRANILVFQHEGQRIAMRVDAVESILSVAEDDGEKLPEVFFREDDANLRGVLEKGIQVPTEGSKKVILILQSQQIIQKLWSAMAA